VEWRAERGLWRCKWRSAVRCCAADVFGKLRGPVARAVLRASVCVCERESQLASGLFICT